MSTPTKSENVKLMDVTLLDTPLPRAWSTVRRQNILDNIYSNESDAQEQCRRSNTDGSDQISKSGESSLGILNISDLICEVDEREDNCKEPCSGIDKKREFARNLLRKCSDTKVSTLVSDTNKENNANVQNLTVDRNPLNIIGSEQPTCFTESIFHAKQSVPIAANESSAISVDFEPNEIIAHSSEISKNSKSLISHSNKSSCGISFDSTIAQIMAQFDDEEFHSASQMANQILADEASWQQNYSYAMPAPTNTEKEYLNLSCFSGIIGELDLSVESCAGRKVSVGQFFRRKCGNIGEISNNAVERPSFGLSIESPKKKEKLVPLVDSTLSDVSPMYKENESKTLTDTTKDVEEHSLMSLSRIAQLLQDIDGTPRKLVDQLIMAKKKKICPQDQDNVITSSTYTLSPLSRQSAPIVNSPDKLDNTTKSLSFSAKLSLDSKILNKALSIKDKVPRRLLFETNANLHAMDTVADLSKEQTLKADIRNKNMQPSNRHIIEKKQFPKESQITNQKSVLENTKLPSSYYNIGTNDLQQQAAFVNTSKENRHFTPVKEEIGEKDTLKKEIPSYISLTDINASAEYSLSRIQIQSIKDIICRNSQEICYCIVGISREANIELKNIGNRWIICSFSICQIQGDQENILLELPNGTILINPDSMQVAKVGIKMIKMGKPVIVRLNVNVIDMVTRVKSIINHTIYFEPEELQVDIMSSFQNQKLDFQYINENNVVTLPVVLQNKNNTDLLITFLIMQNEVKVFSINKCYDEFKYLLIPQEQLTINVQCEGNPSVLNDQTTQKQLISIDAKIVIQVENEKDKIIIKEMPLCVQIGSCRIHVIDVELPIIIHKKQTKPLTVMNTGSMPVTVSASLAESEQLLNLSKEFSVKPSTLMLQCNKTGSFFITFKPHASDYYERHIRIKLTAGSNTYYYSVVGQCNIVDAENDNHFHCETPPNLACVSSPTSPHSILSSRSGNSGRNSPSSSASGATVAGNKIPIKATHAALVWNSVKTGKNDTKEFTICNTSDNKIKIQAIITDNNKSFKFLREKQSLSTNIVLALHRMESKTISVVFCPHYTGAAFGKIIFRHYESKKEDNESRPSKAMFLYGYGGCCKVEISEVFKDISGKMWLSLGKLNFDGALNAKLKVQNTGDLCSYAKIKLTPKAVYPAKVSSWHVNPTELLLEPTEIQWITLEFHPRKEDLALLRRADVSLVGTLTITYGDEPTRWRIRRLYNKVKETGEISGSENETFRNIIYPICRAFPGEQLIPDLNVVRDTVQNLGDLCRGVHQHEIMLTMETSADETLSVLQDTADESDMYYSLCSDSRPICEATGESFLPSETMAGCEDMLHHEMCQDYFTVNPSVILLTPPTRTEATVTIFSTSRVAQPFETAILNSDAISIVPAKGMIPAGREFSLKIVCKQRVERSCEAILEIYTENTKQDVTIKVAVKRH